VAPREAPEGARILAVHHCPLTHADRLAVDGLVLDPDSCLTSKTLFSELLASSLHSTECLCRKEDQILQGTIGRLAGPVLFGSELQGTVDPGWICNVFFRFLIFPEHYQREEYGVRDFGANHGKGYQQPGFWVKCQSMMCRSNQCVLPKPGLKC
jgi:hypothetical protein